MCKCCPTLHHLRYAFTDRYDGRFCLTSERLEVLSFAKVSQGITADGYCTRCGFQFEDLEWTDRDAFVSHCETMRDPL